MDSVPIGMDEEEASQDAGTSLPDTTRGRAEDLVSFPPKLIMTLFVIGSGVRYTDLHLRRDFAARELMLMLIEEQGRELEDALTAASAKG